MPAIPSGVVSQLISEKSLPASRWKPMFAPLTVAFTLALALAFAAGLAGMAAAQSPAPQPLHYWHVWVDSAGTTHQTQCEFKDFSPLSSQTQRCVKGKRLRAAAGSSPGRSAG